MNDTLNVAVAVWQGRGEDPADWLALADILAEQGKDGQGARWVAGLAITEQRAGCKGPACLLRKLLWWLSLQPVERSTWWGWFGRHLVGHRRPAEGDDCGPDVMWGHVHERLEVEGVRRRNLVRNAARHCGVIGSLPPWKTLIEGVAGMVIGVTHVGDPVWREAMEREEAQLGGTRWRQPRRAARRRAGASATA